jgi:hypothetical protein
MGRTFLAPVSFGLGDLVVSLPAIQALIVDNPPVWLVARAPAQRLLAARIEGLAGVVDEAALSLCAGDRVIDLRDHPLQCNHWWGSAAFEAEYGPMDINSILQRICADFGIHADFGRPTPLQANARTDLDRTILLINETDGIHKSWGRDRWTTLASLLGADGHRVAQLTRGDAAPASESLDVPAVVARTPPEVVDVLAGCRGVVGIDTGPTHIAVQQGRPTVTICRRTSVYVRPWPHSAALRGDDCTPRCVAAEGSYAYNRTVSLRDFRPPARACPSERACLAGVRPEDAVNLLRTLL